MIDPSLLSEVIDFIYISLGLVVFLLSFIAGRLSVPN